MIDCWDCGYFRKLLKEITRKKFYFWSLSFFDLGNRYFNWTKQGRREGGRDGYFYRGPGHKGGPREHTSFWAIFLYFRTLLGQNGEGPTKNFTGGRPLRLWDEERLWELSSQTVVQLINVTKYRNSLTDNISKIQQKSIVHCIF
jgi:hypothetical protein